mmetsp:Transcript_16871/g.24716  ORF Transcript_16871/g.24716 Transcript_16871/m.24716 type:complete len:98 (-) Transcript_16871:1334-1627(-)
MSMPLLYQLHGFIIPHPLPPNEVSPFRLPLDPINDGPKDRHQAEEGCRGNLMIIQEAAEGNTEQDPGGHNDAKDHCAEVLDRVKDSQLSNGRTNGKE